MKIIITGGHHTPALAVIDALITNYQLPITSFFWLGHKYSMRGDKNASAEFREVTEKGIPFYDLEAGKFYRTFHPLKWLRLPWGFFQAFYYLAKIRPQLVLSFGGYLAVPVAAAGYLFGIPVFTHEQTVVGGLANRLIARFARKVFISWPQSEKYFPRDKVVLTGNPLRSAIFRSGSPLQFPHDRPAKRDRTKFATLFITGGKQGSHVINEAVRGALSELLKHFNVIHQCGSSTLYDDYKVLSTVRNQLPKELKSGYLLKDYFGEEEIGAVFRACDFVVSRAGANSIYELAALGKPAVLIPIPWASRGEQERNAQMLVDAGSALILPQKNLSPFALIQACMEIKAGLERYEGGGKEAKKLVRLDAAERIAKEVLRHTLNEDG